MFFLVTGGALAAGLFVLLSVLAGSGGGRLLRRSTGALVGVAVLYAAFGGLCAWFIYGMRCDESCYGEGWRNATDAWQWTGQLVVATTGLVALLMAARFFHTGRYRGARAGVVAAALLFGIWALFQMPLTSEF